MIKEQISKQSIKFKRPKKEIMLELSLQRWGGIFQVIQKN